jgi:hypothetical protein
MSEILQAVFERLAMSERKWVRVALTGFLGAVCVALLTIPLWARFL